MSYWNMYAPGGGGCRLIQHANRSDDSEETERLSPELHGHQLSLLANNSGSRVGNWMVLEVVVLKVTLCRISAIDQKRS